MRTAAVMVPEDLLVQDGLVEGAAVHYRGGIDGWIAGKGGLSLGC